MNGFTVRSVIVNGVNKGAIQINEPESSIALSSLHSVLAAVVDRRHARLSDVQMTLYKNKKNGLSVI